MVESARPRRRPDQRPRGYCCAAHRTPQAWLGSSGPVPGGLTRIIPCAVTRCHSSAGANPAPATVRVWTPPRMQPFSESPPLSATTSGSPSAAIAPVERGPATRLARNELPARSAAAVTRKGRSGAKDPRSGLTAAGDRARGRRAPSTPGVCLFREKSSFLQMARCMRSGAVVCPASLLAASHPPRACMELPIRGSSPNRPSVLEGTAANAGFPDPVSLTVCP